MTYHSELSDIADNRRAAWLGCLGWQAGQRQAVHQGGCLRGSWVTRVLQFDDDSKVLKLEVDLLQQLTVSRKLHSSALKGDLLMTSPYPGSPWKPSLAFLSIAVTLSSPAGPRKPHLSQQPLTHRWLLSGFYLPLHVTTAGTPCNYRCCSLPFYCACLASRL